MRLQPNFRFSLSTWMLGCLLIGGAIAVSEQLEPFKPYNPLRTYTSFSADGKRSAIKERDLIKIKTTSNGEVVTTIHSPADRLAFSTDGQELLTFRGQTVQIWDADTGEHLTEFVDPPMLGALWLFSALALAMFCSVWRDWRVQ